MTQPEATSGSAKAYCGILVVCFDALVEPTISKIPRKLLIDAPLRTIEQSAMGRSQTLDQNVHPKTITKDQPFISGNPIPQSAFKKAV